MSRFAPDEFSGLWRAVFKPRKTWAIIVGVAASCTLRDFGLQRALAFWGYTFLVGQVAFNLGRDAGGRS